jgi:transposase
MRPPGSPEQLERRRKQALRLLQRGYPPVEVARRVGVDRRSVRRWNAAYRKHGRQGIEAKPAPGRPRKLDARALRQLERLLLAGAQAAGFPTDLWTCPRIARLIAQRWGVRYQASGVWRLLRSLGWSAQKPERRAVERNEREIRRWVQKQWPRIKKSVPAEGTPGFP